MGTWQRVKNAAIGKHDYKWDARVYAKACPQLLTLSPRHQYSCVKKIGESLSLDRIHIAFSALFYGCAKTVLILSVPVLISMWFFLVAAPFLAFATYAAGSLLLYVAPARAGRIIRRCVNDYLDTPVCVECGYDLQGQPEPVRCPECDRRHVV